MKLLVLALCVAGASAGFCDDKGGSGWGCDASTQMADGSESRKYCSCTLDCDRRLQVSAEDKAELEEFHQAKRQEEQHEAADTSAFLELLEKEDTGATPSAGRQLSRRYRFYRSFVSRRRRFRGTSCKWKCEKQSEEKCANGCLSGSCKSKDMVCGTSMFAPTSDPGKTCAEVFNGGTALENSGKMECEASTDTDNKVCPLGNPTWGFPSGFLPWQDKQDSAQLIKDGAKAAAIDAQWFRDVLFKRMYLPLNVTETIGGNTSHPLYANRVAVQARLDAVKAELEAEFVSKKEHYISFSCLRNIAQCKADQGFKDPCISQCNKVSQNVKDFNAKCNALAAAAATAQYFGDKTVDDNMIYDCRPLGQVVDGEYLTYERDCDGSNPEAEYPALCAVFQNDYVPSTKAASGSNDAPIFGLTAVAAAIALFLSR